MLRANHQLVKFTQDGCQSLFYIICENPTKVAATGHHHNVISKALSANFRDLCVVAEMNFRFWYLSWQVWHMREPYPRCTLGLSRKNASKPISVNASALSQKPMSIEYCFDFFLYYFPKKMNRNQNKKH